MSDLSRSRGRRSNGPTRDTMAAEVLGFLAADEERLGRFLALTGATPGSLRSMASTPALADAVLSYLATDETLLVEFAAAQGYPPELVGQAAQSGRREPED